MSKTKMSKDEAKALNALDAIDIIVIADKKEKNSITLTGEKYKRNIRGNIEMTKYKMHLINKKETDMTPLFRKVYKACSAMNDKHCAITLMRLFYTENIDRLKCDVMVIPTIENKKVYDEINMLFNLTQ